MAFGRFDDFFEFLLPVLLALLLDRPLQFRILALGLPEIFVVSLPGVALAGVLFLLLPLPNLRLLLRESLLEFLPALVVKIADLVRSLAGSFVGFGGQVVDLLVDSVPDGIDGRLVVLSDDRFVDVDRSRIVSLDE